MEQIVTDTKTRRILLIEDDAFILEIYERKFSQVGYDIVVAHDGREAIQYLSGAGGHLPDVILCDVIMTGMGGFEFLAEKERHREWDRIPVVMLTNVSEQEHYDQAERYGVIGYIIKANHTPSEVLHKVEKYLQDYYDKIPD